MREAPLRRAGRVAVYLIHDRDAKFTSPFDEVLRSVGVVGGQDASALTTPNAVAERFVRTARVECLDWLLTLSRRHPERVMRRYAASGRTAGSRSPLPSAPATSAKTMIALTSTWSY